MDAFNLENYSYINFDRDIVALESFQTTDPIIHLLTSNLLQKKKFSHSSSKLKKNYFDAHYLFLLLVLLTKKKSIH